MYDCYMSTDGLHPIYKTLGILAAMISLVLVIAFFTWWISRTAHDEVCARVQYNASELWSAVMKSADTGHLPHNVTSVCHPDEPLKENPVTHDSNWVIVHTVSSK